MAECGKRPGSPMMSLSVAPHTRMLHQQWLYWIAFYLGVPSALALYAGAAESGSAVFISKQYYFFYHLAASLPLWWAMDICTRILQWLLRPWRLPFAALLVLAAVVATNLQVAWTPLRHELFSPFLAEGSRFYAVYPWRYDDPDYRIEALTAWIVASAVWVAANYFFIYVFGIPRLGQQAKKRPLPVADSEASTVADAPPKPADTTTPVPSGAAVLLEKLPPHLGTNIVALKAEEHYTRIYTDKGETLVLMRFSDAVALLGELGGVQTHRSYWVNTACVESYIKDGRNSHIHMKTGVDIPVSRSYRLKVQECLSTS